MSNSGVYRGRRRGQLPLVAAGEGTQNRMTKIFWLTSTKMSMISLMIEQKVAYRNKLLLFLPTCLGILLLQLMHRILLSNPMCHPQTSLLLHRVPRTLVTPLMSNQMRLTRQCTCLCKNSSCQKLILFTVDIIFIHKLFPFLTAVH